MMTSFLAVALVHSINLTFTNVLLSDPSNSDAVFETPREIRQTEVREGQDFLLRCLLTDPSVSNLTLQSEGDTSGRGQSLPPGMTVTFDPKRGALIRSLQRTFTGYYVCSGWKDGRQLRSKAVGLKVAPCKTCLLAYLYVCIPVHRLRFTYLSLFLPACLFVCLSTCLAAGPNLRPSVSVSVSQEKSIRLQGEKFEVTCLGSSPTHLFNLTWTHPKIKVRG